MANRGDIRLGDEAKDSITGLTGVVVAITVWLNGCERVSIQPRELKDGRPVEPSAFDVEQLEVVKASASVPLRKTGGPHDPPTRHADPVR